MLKPSEEQAVANLLLSEMQSSRYHSRNEERAAMPLPSELSELLY